MTPGSNFLLPAGPELQNGGAGVFTWAANEAPSTQLCVGGGLAASFALLVPH